MGGYGLDGYDMDEYGVSGYGMVCQVQAAVRIKSTCGSMWNCP